MSNKTITEKVSEFIKVNGDRLIAKTKSVIESSPETSKKVSMAVLAISVVLAAMGFYKDTLEVVAAGVSFGVLAFDSYSHADKYLEEKSEVKPAVKKKTVKKK
jgi:hypothetical protein